MVLQENKSTVLLYVYCMLMKWLVVLRHNGSPLVFPILDKYEALLYITEEYTLLRLCLIRQKTYYMNQLIIAVVMNEPIDARLLPTSFNRLHAMWPPYLQGCRVCKGLQGLQGLHGLNKGLWQVGDKL